MSHPHPTSPAGEKSPPRAPEPTAHDDTAHEDSSEASASTPPSAAASRLFETVIDLDSDQRQQLLDGQTVDTLLLSRTIQIAKLAENGGWVAAGRPGGKEAASGSPPADPMPRPERVGRYEVLDVLGSGGFGVVFRGHDTVLKRPVAIKTCNTRDQGLRQRFEHEAEISAALQHPNITTVYDYGTEDGKPYLVQELLSGQDLSDRIRKSKDLPVDERLTILLSVAEGLAHAHRQGVVHRDIKPGNIRITDSGEVKILDFGIARLLHHRSGLTTDGTALGTVGYLAPEQLQGKEVDARADVFSFGSLAFEWLTGSLAFPGETFPSVAYKLLYEEPDLASLGTSGMPDGVASLIARCLEKDPSRRPADAGEVAVGLRRILAGEAPETLPEIPGRAEAPGLTRAAVALIVLLGSGLLLQRAIQPERARPEPTQPEPTQPEPTQPERDRPVPTDTATKPGGALGDTRPGDGESTIEVAGDGGRDTTLMAAPPARPSSAGTPAVITSTVSIDS